MGPSAREGLAKFAIPNDGGGCGAAIANATEGDPCFWRPRWSDDLLLVTAERAGALVGNPKAAPLTAVRMTSVPV